MYKKAIGKIILALTLGIMYLFVVFFWNQVMLFQHWIMIMIIEAGLQYSLQQLHDDNTTTEVN